MTVDYPTAEAPATPEYVLAVLRDALPFEFEEDELDFDTPLVDLACAYNDLAWPRTRLIASCLNNLFATTIPLAEWEAAFPGLRGHTVREVCEFLSPRITQPLIRPWRHICGDCLPAGAFLTIRSLLVGAGADPAAVSPSSSLDLHLRRLFASNKLWDFLMALMRLEPGRIPNPGFDFGILGRGYGAVGLAVLAFLLGLLAVGIGALQLAGVLLGFACSLLPAAFLIGFISGYRGPRRIKLDGLLTLRDLSYALAGQQPRRHPFSSPAHDNCGGFVPGTQA